MVQHLAKTSYETAYKNNLMVMTDDDFKVFGIREPISRLTSVVVGEDLQKDCVLN